MLAHMCGVIASASIPSSMQVAEVVRGNAISGNFTVSFQGRHVTVPYNVGPAALVTALESLQGVGQVLVTQSLPDQQVCCPVSSSCTVPLVCRLC